MIRNWVRFLCMCFLFCMLGAGYASGAETDWENMEQMKEELERMTENPDVVNSEEFNKLADSYIQMLIESKGASASGISSEYIVDPEISAEFVSGQIKFTIPNGQNFYASVPKGAVITAPVMFSPIESALTVIEKDGRKMDPPLNGTYSEPGSYKIRMVAYGDGSHMLEEFNFYEITFYFRIIDACANDVNYIYPPEGYEIGGISLEGQSRPVPGRGVFLSENGNYEIWYESAEYPKHPYRFRFVRDTEPPRITFNNQNPGNVYEAPAEFKVNEALRDFYVIHNGMRLEEPSYTLEAEGSYYITAVDEAGNVSEMVVTITENHPFLENLWIIIVAIFFVGSAGAVLYFRKKNVGIL